jgi:hypothetical protein
MALLNQTDCLPETPPDSFNGQELSETDLHNFITDSLNKGKQPLIIFGANWCPDALFLSAVMELPSIKSFLDNHCSLCKVDVGRYDLNMELMPFIGIPSQEGIPRLFVIDNEGTTINLSSNDHWRSARNMTPQTIFDDLQALLAR